MKRLLLLLIILLFISGCHHRGISISDIDEPYLLVTHVKEDALSFVSLEQLEVIREIPILYSIQSIENIDDKTIAFSGKMEEYVRTLDLETGEISYLLETGQSITSLIYDEMNHFLYLTHAGSDSVLFYDYYNNELVSTEVVGSYPNDLQINAQQNELYVLTADDNIISVIDLSTRKKTREFSIMEGATTILFDGKYVYVGGHGLFGNLNHHVYIYDPLTGELVKKVEVGSMPIAFYEDKDLNYIVALCHGTHDMYIIDKETLSVTETISVGSNPYYVMGDEQYLYVTGLDSHDLTVFEKNNFEVVKNVDLLDGPYAMTIGGQKNE